MNAPFNIVCVYANNTYVGYKDTLEEAEVFAQAYIHFGAAVTYQRGWRTMSRFCMRADITVPSANDPQYKASLVYRDNVIRIDYKQKKRYEDRTREVHVV